jgi:hypothetical protein
VLELVGTIAVITSVLVFAWQARELAKQSRIANEVAGAETNRELLLMFRDVHRVFIDHPGLWPQFYDQAVQPPNADDEVRLRIVAEMYADALQVALESVNRLASYERYADAWRAYIGSMLASSQALRRVPRDHPEGWPELAAMVKAYEASQPPAPPRATVDAQLPDH